jgi:hypothetical protein
MILQVFPLPVSLSVSLSVCGGAPGRGVCGPRKQDSNTVNKTAQECPSGII